MRAASCTRDLRLRRSATLQAAGGCPACGQPVKVTCDVLCPSSPSIGASYEHGRVAAGNELTQGGCKCSHSEGGRESGVLAQHGCQRWDLTFETPGALPLPPSHTPLLRRNMVHAACAELRWMLYLGWTLPGLPSFKWLTREKRFRHQTARGTKLQPASQCNAASSHGSRAYHDRVWKQAVSQ